MDRLLCDCVIAVAVLLCVATQVRPALACLLWFVLIEMIMYFSLCVCVCMRERVSGRGGSNNEADFL